MKDDSYTHAHNENNRIMEMGLRCKGNGLGNGI